MKKWYIITLVLFTLSSVMTSCQLWGNVPPPTPAPEMAKAVEVTTTFDITATRKPASEPANNEEIVPITNTPIPSTPTPTLTPTPTPTSTPTATATPTPAPTITPNIPINDANLVFAQSPKVSAFVRPAPVLPPQLSFVNESDFDLKISVTELDKLVPVFKDSFSRIQVAPGKYSYKVAWASEGAPVLADTVTVSAGERVTVTITTKNVSALAFKNESGLEITVNLPDLGESFQVAPGSTTEERPLPPGDYTYTVEAVGSPGPVLTDKADLNPNEVTLVTIKADAITTSDLVVQNDTDFELLLTLSGSSIKPIVVPPRQSSQPQPVPPGEYSYEVSAGGASNTGQVSITPNETKVLAFDLKTVIPDVGGLRFVNQTGSTISISINGVAGAITVAPNETSSEKELPPGTYQYTVEASNFAPYSSEASVEKGYVQEVTIVLGGTRTEVKVINNTGCALTISFSGPDSLSVTISAGQSETVNLQEGNYSYSVQACSAFANYNEYFSGGSEIEFSLN